MKYSLLVPEADTDMILEPGARFSVTSLIPEPSPNEGGWALGWWTAIETLHDVLRGVGDPENVENVESERNIERNELRNEFKMFWRNVFSRIKLSEHLEKL